MKLAINNDENKEISSDFLDWRWQLKNSISSIEELQRAIDLSDEQRNFLQEHFSRVPLPFAITPYFASLMKKDEICPLFKQVIPTSHELVEDIDELRDPLGEEEREKTPHLVHRYPDRVLFLLTDRCATYCRFCTRKRWVGQGPTPKKLEHERAFSYIENNEAIKEIIFSGGDPLLLADETLSHILKRAFSIKNIEIVRFHTRILSFAPMRITDHLCEILSRHSPIYLVTHFNHPNELSYLSILAIKKLIAAGVVVLNQSVLLAGINDEVSILSKLFRSLVNIRVRPYYLHQCDLTKGARHFRVPIKKALSLLKDLRGNISGLCMPHFVIDIPGGFGKVALTPDPIIKEDEKFIYLQGFAGSINAYPKD